MDDTNTTPSLSRGELIVTLERRCSALEITTSRGVERTSRLRVELHASEYAPARVGFDFAAARRRYFNNVCCLRSRAEANDCCARRASSRRGVR